MKTLKQGKPVEMVVYIDRLFSQDIRKEWAGKKINCSYCEFEGELEINDRFLSYSGGLSYSTEHKEFVAVKCPNCAHAIRIAEM